MKKSQIRLFMLIILCAFLFVPGLWLAEGKEKEQNASGYPPVMPGALEKVYKKIGEIELKLYIYSPKGTKATDKKPAIVFFYGGSWAHGSPEQFLKQCQYFSSRGMVAIAADYRVSTRHKVKVVDCVADAKSAVRWVREHSKELGVDPDRIAAGGGSAGGHLAACTGIVPGLDEKKENKKISSQPNCLVLFNPVVILAPVEGELSAKDNKRIKAVERRLGIEAEKISPYHNVKKQLPPTIIMHGKDDTTVPYKTVELFTEAMIKQKNNCKLVGYDKAKHGFFNSRKFLIQTLKETDKFLQSLKYIKGKDTADSFAF